MEKNYLTPGSAQYSRSHDGSEGTSDKQYQLQRPKNELPPPEPRGPRKLVLCFDGTGNKFHGDDSDSNILKIYRMLDRTADDQYHYYQRRCSTIVMILVGDAHLTPDVQRASAPTSSRVRSPTPA
jgi:hypothetical protein